MHALTEWFIGSLDLDNLSPSIEETIYSIIFCKNLVDLCESVRAMINKLPPNNNLPDKAQLKFIQLVLEELININIIDDEINIIWKNVKEISKNEKYTNILLTCYKIYVSIKNNISDNEILIDSIRKKNKKFFIKEYDNIFKDIPYREVLEKFKYILNNNAIEQEDEDLLWDFFQTLESMIENEDKEIIEIKNQRKKYLKKN